MDDRMMLELTDAEARGTAGGYETLYLEATPFMWRGTFGLWGEPVSASPIFIPVQS